MQLLSRYSFILGIMLSISFSSSTLALKTSDVSQSVDSKSKQINSIKAAVQEAKLVVSEVHANDRLGSSVAVSGDYAIIGVENDDFMGTASGTAYIYYFDGTDWVQGQRLVASDANTTDRFGTSVSISGTRVVVGAPGAGADNKGRVYVYDFNGTSWIESQILAPTGAIGNINLAFGSSVSLFADSLLIGSSGDSEFFSLSGAAYVFNFDSMNNLWSQTQRLTVLNAADTNTAAGFGSSVSLFGNTAMIGARNDNDFGNGSGAVYVFEYNILNSAWEQKHKLFAPNAEGFDSFGYSVSSYGNKLVVGSYRDTNSNGNTAGSAFVFEYMSGSNNWQFQEMLLASDGLAGENFGSAVSMANDRLVIGASKKNVTGISNLLGAVYVFDFNGVDSFVESQNFIPADGGNFNKLFGTAVALDKGNMTPNRILIGATGDDEMAESAGSAYVFDFDSTTWSQTQKFMASDWILDDKFGQVVSISGDTAVIGALSDQDMGINAGAVYVFAYVNSNWVFAQKLFADDAATGDFFGYSVSIQGDRLLIGAYGDDDMGNFSGSVYVFENDGNNWIQQHKLIASDGMAGDAFGGDVSLSANRILVGALSDDTIGGNDAGSAYIFNYDTVNDQWNEVTPKLTASDGDQDDNFAISVSLDGDNALIGAWEDDDQGSRSGSAYIFNFDGSSWNQLPKLLPSDIDTDDFFGYEVDIQGDWAVVGANNDDEMGLQSGSAYLYQYNAGTMAWVEFQKLTAGLDAGHFDNFGREISIDGNRLLISSYADDDMGSNSGSVYVYDYNGIWFLNQKLTASDGADNDLFGISVGLSGNRALIGAVGDDNNWIDDGAGYIINIANRYDLKINVSGFAAGSTGQQSQQVAFANGNDAISFGADGEQILSNLADTTAYDISFTQQPNNPIQDCVFDDPNTGNIAGSDVIVNVTCVTRQYELSVRAFGLAAGNSIEVTNNEGDNFVLDTNGVVKVFPTGVDHRSVYTIDLISPQPTAPNQTCTTIRSGTMFGDTLGSFHCTTNQYTIGGTVTGLVSGNELVLQNNTTDNLSLTQDGEFVFDTSLDDEFEYLVSVLNQPRMPHQQCTVSNFDGNLAGNNVSNIMINCIVSPELIHQDGFEEP